MSDGGEGAGSGVGYREAVVVDFSGRGQKKGDGKKIIAGGMDDSVERMKDGKRKCWVGRLY